MFALKNEKSLLHKIKHTNPKYLVQILTFKSSTVLIFLHYFSENIWSNIPNMILGIDTLASTNILSEAK